MKKCILFFLVAFLVSFGVAGDSQAIPLNLSETGNTGNSWGDGERYAFSAGSMDLAPGHYDLAFSVQGMVWAEGEGLHGWEWKDKIIIEAYLGDSLIGSKTIGGMDGQRKPFAFSLSMDFDVTTKTLLKIDVYSDVTHRTEHWRLRSADFKGTFQENPAPAAAPEPASMFLLGSGLFGLVAMRKKFSRKS
jgi:hypothetical protein